MKQQWPVLFSLLAIMAIGATSAAPAPLTVVGADRMHLVVLRGESTLYRLNACDWGPGWTHARMDSLPFVKNGVRVFEQKKVGFWPRGAKEPLPGQFDLRHEVRQQDTRTLILNYAATPVDTAIAFGVPGLQHEPSAAIGSWLDTPPYFSGGKALVKYRDGNKKEVPLPPPPRTGHADVTAVTLTTPDGESTHFTVDPPCILHCDVGELRMFMKSSDKVQPGETFRARITVTLPVDTDFEAENRWVKNDDWIVYQNENDFTSESVIDMRDWLHKPAGKHGWLQIDGARLTFQDGAPAKFYGVGIAWNRFLVSPEEAAQWGDKFAKYGINVVRLIPLAGHGHQGMMSRNDHLVAMPEHMAKFDAFHAAMRERGVYLGWSPQYHTLITLADRKRVIDYDEIKQGAPKMDVTYNILNIAQDIQDLVISQTVAILNHKNPHTGLRYADDPAIAWIELRNENDIFFNFDNFAQVEKTFPGYFRRFQQRFCKYLKQKYKTQEALEKAWGASYPSGTIMDTSDVVTDIDMDDLGLEEAETYGNIRPHYPSAQMGRKATPYITDTLRFMYKEQHDFYTRYVKAIRAAGYQGALDGSCWQASCWLGHLFNMLTDAEVGIIDRHNYNATPLNQPGAGNMSVGFQQVKNRPFNFSEWGGGPVAVPTVAVYGLGLQGWDISCQFASAKPYIFNRTARDCNTDCDDFIQIGQFPALARMVHRGDVREGEVLVNRRISLPGLRAGDAGILERFTLLGGANNKSFSSVVPNSALMAGRVVLEFVEGKLDGPPLLNNVDDYIDAQRKLVRSSTGQLAWHYAGQGYYTVNTPASQAVIGHVRDKPIKLDDVTLTTTLDGPVKLYVTSLERDKSIRKAQRLLITAFGRDANTGMIYDAFGGVNLALAQGKEPLLLEPVEATIMIKGRIKKVYALDHGGRLRQDPGTAIKVRNSAQGSTFRIEGKSSRTMYYLVEKE